MLHRSTDDECIVILKTLHVTKDKQQEYRVIDLAESNVTYLFWDNLLQDHTEEVQIDKVKDFFRNAVMFVDEKKMRDYVRTIYSDDQISAGIHEIEIDEYFHKLPDNKQLIVAGKHYDEDEY